MSSKVLTQDFTAPLNHATTASVDIHTGAGNLTIDPLTEGEPVLASGTLQYRENHSLPTQSVSSDNGHAKLTLRAEDNGHPLFRLPWSTCNGAFEWQIHLNPTVSSELTVHSGGGNIKLNLAGMAIARLCAATGGGNMDVVLPDHAADLGVTAKTGAGNVTVALGSDLAGRSTVDAQSGAGNVVVYVPGGTAARIHASSGLGKVIMDPRFSKIDKDTYASSDYDGAGDKLELTVTSGAGNVTVSTR